MYLFVWVSGSSITNFALGIMYSDVLGIIHEPLININLRLKYPSPPLAVHVQTMQCLVCSHLAF